ncbi:MAG: hypothetical protein COU30_04420 [Candidatus Magasanikbacteria bacterium CG10_big_fil_rev_8_21_14_0_10_38_6]|uniref:STAS/SEC14 domain-containing protein n=1 Tax=Candidatus Magasanikbacteria bacterium CG10_big_fil_rev_8_21_14_0_10_38_6 TaxID=1974647 RepID=A0A2M6P0Y7_9BACT|nr:MAG: hypothetical protein COU30_04420 [Candidatus Magasanikbacteria bacterium CG10_big_fil_rev_8_21_14_0_10_38_6]
MSDQEIFKVFSVEYDNTYDIIRATFIHTVSFDEDNTRMAQLFQERLLSFFEKHPEKMFDVLVDTKQIHYDEHTVTKEARDIYQDLFNHEQTGRVAIVAGAGTFSFLTKFVVSLFMKKKKTQFFIDPTKAVVWLDSDR